MSDALLDMAQWQLVKDLNAAKYNKAALELFVDEQQQLIDFTYRLTEQLNEAVHQCRGIYDQRMALELIGKLTLPVVERIQQLQGANDYRTRGEVLDAETSLPPESVPLVVDIDGKKLDDLSTADLEDLVRETRGKCAIWLNEREQLRKKLRSLRSNNSELDAKRAEAEKHNSLTMERRDLQREVHMLENSCETLSKLLSLRRR